MILLLVRLVVDPLTSVLTLLVRSVLWFSLFFSLAYSLGWVQRLLWFLLEQSTSDLWNGTPVTIGSLEIDLIRGRIWATNVVIHTPKREEWGWESPLICRIGRLYVEHNWITSFFTMVVKMACGHGQKQILELYTIEVSDIQGFIERKQHIFNFYLMDQWLDLPDPKDLDDNDKEARKKSQIDPHARPHHHQQQSADVFSSINNANDGNRNDNQSEASVDFSMEHPDQVEAAYAAGNNNNTTTNTSVIEEDKDILDEQEDEIAHRQAQQLVDDMFSAVKSIGRAAQQKGSFVGAFIEQRAQLATKLKQFKGTKNKTEAMQEGVKVIQRVGKAVAKKTKTLQNVMPKMPNRREPDIPPVYGRVGRVIIEDARVFTRINTNSTTSMGASTATTSTAGTSVSGSTIDTSKQFTSPGGHQPGAAPLEANEAKWNKPIGISEMVLRSAELCPPNSLLDDRGLPAVYQPLDTIADVVMKRALVGLAKSNTSRFLQTALGEFLEMEYSTIFGETEFANPSTTGRQSPMPPTSSTGPGSDTGI
ncbi:expressed unknown protein [Seminavis robusta]|uniref:Uncharacterized protein n=1 Tax=Seminavis robusta TaxID=568900 RepID=A0A9N8HG91_9STRA|nr:expressed unknown protein [Seminavis robusta]|eukprot:Sro497_g154720.1 n/a (535) ;mRNA; f:11523-13217